VSRRRRARLQASRQISCAKFRRSYAKKRPRSFLESGQIAGRGRHEPICRRASSTSFLKATEAPPGCRLSHSQGCGSSVTSFAMTPSRGRPRPRGSATWRFSAVSCDFPRISRSIREPVVSQNPHRNGLIYCEAALALPGLIAFPARMAIILGGSRRRGKVADGLPESDRGATASRVRRPARAPPCTWPQPDRPSQ
jgi:hypothetical protein